MQFMQIQSFISIDGIEQSPNLSDTPNPAKCMPNVADEDEDVATGQMD